MVRVKHNPVIGSDGHVDVSEWLHLLSCKEYFQDTSMLQNAVMLCEVTAKDQSTDTGQSCLEQGLAMADILADLEIDQETLSAAVLFQAVLYADLSLDDISEQVSPQVAKLIKGVLRMSALNHLHASTKFGQSKTQLDNVRKMLLAMVDDVRVVLIKLAERLCVLRATGILPSTMQKQIATEAMEIYAPLANRLGIGAIKWEMEDLAFRFLHTEEYKAIAKGLKTKRLERDNYVNRIVDELTSEIKKMGVSHFSVYGRSKHINSIYKKMMRKNVPIDEIYDATAVRVLVDTSNQCYDVLSLVHHLYKQIPHEFDDYIINPKSNGYQSLHTAVTGPEDRVFEVQIRSFQMHDFAEMGVAAHWKYKEGSAAAQESHERKIEWLRSVLAWHKDMASNSGISETIESEFLDDRVYIFTPDGDVLDLPKGVTPLDFAYHVHTELGHRCRGAKANGAIVPLTYTLKTGDKIEILSGKDIKPSRDWINPHYNYLKTSRAKAKVLHWFKSQDFDKNREEGEQILDKELKTLGLKNDKLMDAATSFNFKKVDDLYAALGRGDLKLSQVIHRLSPTESTAEITPTILKPTSKHEFSGSDIRIEGVGNLLTHMARCCQPIPGDDVIGYITVGKGVSIHRKDCSNIIHATEKQKDRFLQITWGHSPQEHYLVNLIIKAYDRAGLLKDITSLLAAEKTHIYALQTHTNQNENLSTISISVEVDSLTSLSKLISKIEHIPNVIEARRQA